MPKPTPRLTATLLAAAGLVALAASPAVAVHGGTVTSTSAHPFMVVLENPDGSQWCGGALIAPDKVLTAGHCVRNSPDPMALTVTGGRTDLATDAGRVRRVKAITVDPKFDIGTLDHDAAVLTLTKPLPYKPLRIATKKDAALYENGRTASVYGWGMTATNTPGQKLKQATLKLAPLSTCEPFTEPGSDPSLRVCGVPTKGTTDSICAGDSGGPLVANGVLIGIVSTGNKYCDTQYPVSVFTKASTVAPELGL
ncbi:Trypsin [Streptomyces hundungensis]|uniref:Trypsin n=1 Tax=Streptomyces hundungensis TaxID=1077946 RepID=A0A387HGL6_9ACTN|nr:serine protease [Streptomyces hundungensis]AYG81413.1 Trypsin [Streptomyces hundungensis]